MLPFWPPPIHQEIKREQARHEPVLMTITYKQGRIFHTTLGHAVNQLKLGSFVTTFSTGHRVGGNREGHYSHPPGLPPDSSFK
jgi:type 1 glutamine amidotransferase